MRADSAPPPPYPYPPVAMYPTPQFESSVPTQAGTLIALNAFTDVRKRHCAFKLNCVLNLCFRRYAGDDKVR